MFEKMQKVCLNLREKQIEAYLLWRLQHCFSMVRMLKPFW